MPIFPGPGGGGGSVDAVLYSNQSKTQYGGATPLGDATHPSEFYLDAQEPPNGPMVGAVANGGSNTSYVQWNVPVLPGQTLDTIAVEFAAELALEGGAEASTHTIQIQVNWISWDFNDGGAVLPVSPDTGIFDVTDFDTFSANFDTSAVPEYSMLIIVLKATITETSGADNAFFYVYGARVVAGGQ